MRLLKWFFISLFGIVGLVITAVLVIWLNPELVINNKTAKWAYAKQSTAQFDQGFPDSLHISIKNSDFFLQKIKNRSEKLLFEGYRPFDSCLL